MGSPRSQMKVLLHELIEDAPTWKVQAMGQKRTMYLVEINPETAERAIEYCNLRNRKVRQNKVLENSKHMEDGHWQLMGMLVFTAGGEMIDGQHRLLAVAEAGVPIAFVLMVVSQREAAVINRYLDNGPPRNLADYLHFNGVENSHRVGPILVYERNAKVSGSPLQSLKGEKQDYLDLYRDMTAEPFKRVFEVMPRGLHKVLGVNRAFLDWFALRLVQFDASNAELFFGLLDDPSELKKTDAPYVLREALVELQRKHQRVSITQQAHMTAKAWRYYSEGQPATPGKIRHRANEDWPGILGDPQGYV